MEHLRRRSEKESDMKFEGEAGPAYSGVRMWHLHACITHLRVQAAVRLPLCAFRSLCTCLLLFLSAEIETQSLSYTGIFDELPEGYAMQLRSLLCRSLFLALQLASGAKEEERRERVRDKCRVMAKPDQPTPEG